LIIANLGYISHIAQICVVFGDVWFVSVLALTEPALQQYAVCCRRCWHLV